AVATTPTSGGGGSTTPPATPSAGPPAGGPQATATASLVSGTGYSSAPIVRIAGSSTRVTIITTPPVAPKPALSPLSDTGLPVVPRGSDNITDNPTPVFVGTVLPGATVALRGGDTAAGTTTADLTTGAYSP